MNRPWLWIALLVLLPAHADARGRTRPAGPEEPGYRFRGRPLPECTRFAITEMGFHHSIATLGSGRLDPPEDLAVADVGVMFNRTERHAWGGSATLEHNTRSVRVGLMGRYRRWLPDGRSVDVSFGPMVREARGLDGVAASVAYCLADVVKFETRLETRGNEPASVYFGAKAGSHAGIVLLVCGAIVAAIGSTVTY